MLAFFYFFIELNIAEMTDPQSFELSRLTDLSSDSHILYVVHTFLCQQ